MQRGDRLDGVGAANDLDTGFGQAEVGDLAGVPRVRVIMSAPLRGLDSCGQASRRTLMRVTIAGLRPHDHLTGLCARVGGRSHPCTDRPSLSATRAPTVAVKNVSDS